MLLISVSAILFIVLDVVLDVTWSKIFYKYGFKIFNLSVENRNLKGDFFTVLKGSALEKKYDHLVFYKLNDHTVYVREAVIQSGISMLPVMHGVLTLSNNKTNVVGLLNWGVVCAYILITLTFMLYDQNIGFASLILSILMIAGSYVKQKKQFSIIISSI